MFVCELVVLASANISFDTIWKISNFTQNPNGVLHLSGLLCVQVFLHYKRKALKLLAMCMIYCVLVLMQPWFTDFSRFVKSILTGKMKLNIKYFLMLLFVQKSRKFLVQFLLLSKLSSCAGLVALSKLYLRKIYSTVLL